MWKTLFTRVERAPGARRQDAADAHPRCATGWRPAGRGVGRGAERRAIAATKPRPPPASAPPWRFARQSWVSDAARALWQPRMERIADVLGELALARVADGLERVRGGPGRARRGVPADDARGRARAARRAARRAAARRGRARPSGWGRTARWVRDRAAGERDAYRRLRAAGDRAALAALCGVPVCCAEAEARRGRGEDPTWAAALGDGGGAGEGPALDLTVDPRQNPLLRRLGLGLVPHRPCALDCAPSLAMAGRIVELGRAAGHGREMDWLLEILGLADLVDRAARDRRGEDAGLQDDPRDGVHAPSRSRSSCAAASSRRDAVRGLRIPLCRAAALRRRCRWCAEPCPRSTGPGWPSRRPTDTTPRCACALATTSGSPLRPGALPPPPRRRGGDGLRRPGGGALRPRRRCSRPRSSWPRAPDHPNLPAAAAYLRRWPAAYAQFQRLVDTIDPYLETTIPGAPRGGARWAPAATRRRRTSASSARR